jgi:hypothetical protein
MILKTAKKWRTGERMGATEERDRAEGASRGERAGEAGAKR